ncbi:hypothetical protein pEaSNUABM40_00139 [Erwinia phage pEa_SNUABM_40]|uniref:Uncharacterized protein n=1 Tax=Erwinia phage pEa_SNUABM_3 TaxID=2869552 RepID=A0AAE8BYS1_9CAUD|nr:hypothetical protein MPK68_gp138 [Erwinia phage pEa_SNUABM_3]QZE56674.1 hypothetical protein pEaSNUABM20_00138 [Erwinia phage pEa_SNUABM_20]QZE58355.1 hypothetical protein pEaSNUABM40_00139 [Erwinia phage pEa_SNUABM_40]UAW52919.1 hypothetical protein pEaSNUABM23_00137 [Erwinia phage pEa_SNUABM_23]UIW10815.1 hypothetical protein pEaSNUABM23_00137 [Erwinia phage pEa_SNUABM_31]QZE56335.1 hypothetical protein pEaSNUABM3_00138 [Erwinia phage pEa_SNUABM_3]
MYTRQKYRKLDRTLVIDTRVRSVSDRQNAVLSRQSSAVGIPLDGMIQQQSIVVGPKGYQVPEIKGLLYIDTAEPIILQFAGGQMVIEGQFVFTGQMAQSVLVSDVDQRVNLVCY